MLCSSLVVLGSAGSGKTWLLKKFCHIIATETSICVDDLLEIFYLPIFIPLSTMAILKKDQIMDYITGN